jgi:hypothetical protein
MVTGPLMFRHETSPVIILPIISSVNVDLSQVSATALPKAENGP